MPTLTAEENILLPLDLAGQQADQAWFDQVVDAVGLRPRLSHRPERDVGWPAAAGGLRPGAREPPVDRLRRRAHRQPRLHQLAEVLGFLRRSVDEFGQTVVMVTHDPVAASYSDRVLFLADGKIVDELRDPDRDAILDEMARPADAARARRAERCSA